MLVIYLDASFAVVGALGEKGIGQDGVGTGECLTNRGDGNGDSLLEHGGHGEMCMCGEGRVGIEERREEEKKVGGRRNEGTRKIKTNTARQKHNKNKQQRTYVQILHNPPYQVSSPYPFSSAELAGYRAAHLAQSSVRSLYIQQQGCPSFFTFISCSFSTTTTWLTTTQFK